MRTVWKEILAAAMLGVLLPRVVLGTVTWLFPGGQGQNSPDQTQPQYSETQPTAEVMIPTYVPVLTGKASLRVMELEEYVLCVVLAEMPAYFHTEALKAQAVVARTYALRRIARGDRHPDGAVCTDSGCCQALLTREEYLQVRGTPRELETIRQAVAATAGQILLYEGSLAETTYFSCSGGKTEDALEVWGTSYPYLQSVSSPGEEDAANYRVKTRFTPDDFAAALSRQLSGNPEQWLGKTTYTQGGGVKTMDICGKTYSGIQLRDLLALNSASFSIWVEEGMLVVETSGKGHRVGMSQYGADAMAETGKTYLEILGYYYPGTGIDKIGAIG